MKTRPTIEPGYKYWHRGPQWARVSDDWLLHYWTQATDSWSSAGIWSEPHGLTWREFTEADQLKEELEACSAMVHTLEAQLAESRGFLRISRAKNSALRKAKWEAAGSKRREAPKPVADEPLRRWYHRDDGFTDGTKFFEIRDGQVYTDQGKARVDHTAKSWEYASKSFVPEGIWIEVRGTNVPANLPKPPAVPKGFTHWEYRTSDWRTSGRTEFVWFSNAGQWVRDHAGFPMGLHDHYLEARGGGSSEAPREGYDVGGLKSLLTQETIDEVLKDVSRVEKMIFATPQPQNTPKDASNLASTYAGPWKWIDIPNSTTPPAPKTRIFRSVKGFVDSTDRVEFVGGKATIVSNDGTRYPSLYFTVAKAEKAVRDNQWYEVFDDSAQHIRASVQKYAEVISRDFDLNRDITVRAALTQKFGEVPPMAVLIKHLHRVIDHNKVEHWLWLDKPLQIGEKAPLNKAICRINPPSFGPCGSPQS